MPHHSVCFMWVRKSTAAFAPDFLSVTTAFTSNSKEKQNTFPNCQKPRVYFAVNFHSKILNLDSY